MHRFYLAPEAWTSNLLRLDAAESHHAANVLRAKKGVQVVVFDGRGVQASAEIVEAGNRGVLLQKISESRSDPARCRVTLAQAIPKGKNMDLIIEKATELGAAAIIPLLTDRTIVRYEPEEATAKQLKWQRVAIEAAKQCGQNRVPIVNTPASYKSVIANNLSFDLKLIASLQQNAERMKTVFSKIDERPTSVVILIGPEGDFTPAEITAAEAAGCHPVTLGPIILRTETAALYCLSILAHEFF